MSLLSAVSSLDQAAELLSEAPVLLVWLDQKGRVRRGNRYFEKLTGWPLAEAQGRDWFSTFLPRDDQERVRDWFLTALTGQQTGNAIHRLVTRAGLERDIEWQSNFLHDDAGNSTGVLCVGVDITDRIHAERVVEKQQEALRQSQAQLAEAEQIAQLGIWTLDLVRNELTWSEEMYRIFEIDPKQSGASYEAFLAAIHPDDRELVDRAYKRASLTREPYEIEHRLLLGEGRVKYIRERGRTTYDEAGRPLRTMGTVQDISGRVQSEHRLQHILDSLFSFVTVFDLEGVILETNRAPLDAAGLQREDVIGRPFWDTYWWSHSAEERAKIRSTIERAARGEIVRDDFHVRVGEDRFIIVDAMFGPLREDGGRFTKVIGCGVDVTERKRAEGALQESEHRLSLIFNANSDLQALVRVEPDQQLSVVAANRTYVERIQQMLPGRPIIIAGQNRQEFLAALGMPESMYENETRLYRQVIETGTPAKLEHSIPADNFDWTLEVTIDPILNAEGRCTHLLWSGRDVTERRRAEKALRETADRLTLAQEAGHVGVFDWDLITHQVIWTPELEAIFGFGRGEFRRVYEDWAARVHPDDQPRLEVLFSEWMQSNRTEEQWEYRILRHGEVRWIAARARLIRNASGRPIRMIGTNLDMTERKRAEEALRESEAHANAILASLTEGILLYDTEAVVVKANGPLQVLQGQHLRNMIDPALGPILHGDGSPFTYEQQPAVVALKTGTVVRDVEMGVPEPEGVRRWYSVNAQPVRDPSGKIQGAVTSFFDITTRKETEESLRNADRRKNEFLAMLSHELRNPLAAIRTSSYTLKRATPGGEQATRAHAVIERQTGHMSRLIDDLLDVTRITRGKINLRKERVELNGLLRTVVEDTRELFARSGVQLAVVEAGQPLYLDADPTRLAQVLENLLSNAAKFTPRGGHVTLVSDVDGAGSALIRVRDDGEGIAPEVLTNVFEPFVQAEQSLDRSRGGLGLGLALVKGLVDLHNGTVNAESRGRGQGAQFTVSLPLAVPIRPQPAAGADVGKDTLRRILVIEDNVDVAEALKEALLLGDHDVEVAYTGPDGVAKAHAFRPDVVICDIGLPGLDGYGVARAIRKDPQLGSTLLIAVSGYAAPEDVEKSREAGFTRHFGKPMDFSVLEKVLADAAR